MIKLRGPMQPSTLLLLLVEVMTANNLSAEVDGMIERSILAVEVSDIQAAVLRPRRSPDLGEHLILRIGGPVQGRGMSRRIIAHIPNHGDAGCAHCSPLTEQARALRTRGFS